MPSAIPCQETANTMPSPTRRSSPRLGRSGPVSVIIAIIVIAYGLLTGSLNLRRSWPCCKGSLRPARRL